MIRAGVPANTNLAALSPVVRRRIELVLAGMLAAGFRAVQFDTVRTVERQAFLFGKGRSATQLLSAGLDAKWAWPTCPDGVVTNAAHAAQSWHAHGCACDVVENDNSPWNASQAFWNTLGALARTHYLTWGGAWRMLDLPHMQAVECPMSPTPEDRALLQREGMAAVWKKYRLD
jgi:hypothetical protein